jgi:GNAT superfamily N-acetyltransferase
MRIERATLSSADEARRLMDEYNAAVGVVQTDSPQELVAYLSSPTCALWMAYDGEEPAGCVVLRPLPSVSGAGECKRLYVRPPWRGRGVAAALMQVLEAQAHALGWTQVFLDSKDDLTAAIALYRSRGYEPCAPYNSNPQATVFLRKVLDL